MLGKLLSSIIRSLDGHLPFPGLNWAPAIEYNSLKHTSSKGLTVRDIFDGLMLATPKNRTPIRRILRKRYGNDNWPDGVKLFKPRSDIATCTECGHFYEFHAICRNCFSKVEEESKKIIESIRKTWGIGIIDKEVQVLYQGENAAETVTESKRVVELDRPRPLWFAPNLSQKAAQPSRTIGGGSAKELNDQTVRFKEEK